MYFYFFLPFHATVQYQPCRVIQYIYLECRQKRDCYENNKCFDLYLRIENLQDIKPKPQNFLDPGLAKPQSWLNIGLKNTDLG